MVGLACKAFCFVVRQGSFRPRRETPPEFSRAHWMKPISLARRILRKVLDKFKEATILSSRSEGRKG